MKRFISILNNVTMLVLFIISVVVFKIQGIILLLFISLLVSLVIYLFDILDNYLQKRK